MEWTVRSTFTEKEMIDSKKYFMKIGFCHSYTVNVWICTRTQVCTQFRYGGVYSHGYRHRSMGFQLWSCHAAQHIGKLLITKGIKHGGRCLMTSHHGLLKSQFYRLRGQYTCLAAVILASTSRILFLVFCHLRAWKAHIPCSARYLIHSGADLQFFMLLSLICIAWSLLSWVSLWWN